MTLGLAGVHAPRRLRGRAERLAALLADHAAQRLTGIDEAVLAVGPRPVGG